MNKSLLIDKSVYIITEYYKNNLNPLFQNIDDNVLWFGPADGQFLQTKEKFVSAWTNEHHSLTFTMSNINAVAVPLGPRHCEIILFYKVYTHYPDGITHVHNQRIQYSWHEKTCTGTGNVKNKTEKIMVLNVSNTNLKDERDFIYPVHYETVAPAGSMDTWTSRRILMHGTDTHNYYILSTSICWIESSDNGKHSIVHTLDKTIYAKDRLSYFEKQYPGCFLHAHASHIVNPVYIHSLSRFKITMNDGTELAVPEKKYTAFKNELNKWIEKWNK